jgi:hypothetical protein
MRELRLYAVVDTDENSGGYATFDDVPELPMIQEQFNNYAKATTPEAIASAAAALEYTMRTASTAARHESQIANVYDFILKMVPVGAAFAPTDLTKEFHFSRDAVKIAIERLTENEILTEGGTKRVYPTDCNSGDWSEWRRRKIMKRIR